MTDDQQTQFRQQLLLLRDNLMAVQQDGQSITEPVKLDQVTIDLGSHFDAVQSHSIANQKRGLRLNQLRQIVTALALIQSGDYGFCVHCDTKIDIKSLAIDPTITLCMLCASRPE